MLVLSTLAALFAGFVTATPARAADTQASYLADRLRENPVYVSDQLPREVPKSMTRDFARVAKGTGVPTYVLVLPSGAAYDDGLLGAVHDRLGRDGLYVILDESSVASAMAYGVSVPVDDALAVTLYELPYDAGPLRELELFAEVVTQGAEKAAARAESARAKYEDGEPAPMYLGPSDRENQSFLTGMLITGAPLLIVLLVPYVRRLRRRKRTGRWWVAPAAALATAGVIVVTAPLVFDQTRSSASPRPRAIDLNARLDRVVEGLAQAPVYTDPESPRVLDAAQLTRLHGRIEKFERSEGGGPVFVSVVPQLPEDESEGDGEMFADSLHDKLGEDGLYVVADPLYGDIEVFNHGLRLDSLDLAFELPDSIALVDDKAREADDHRLGERLDALMNHLDKAPRTEDPDSIGDPYPVTNPVTEDDLPTLYGADDFEPGLFMGALAGGAVFGLVAAVIGIVRRVIRRRRPEPLATDSLPEVSPTEPSMSYLRTVAKTELRALTRGFEDAPPRSDPRPGDCLDAATLLLDGDPGRIADADAATLLAVVVLARSGRAALEGKGYNRCCAVNPLHGPAVNRHHVRVSADTRARRMLHLCGLCLDTAIAAPSTLRTRMLTLPGSEARVPYEEADDLLTAVPDGVRRLIERVKERVHVP
ncbi:hypothetical protein [Streptomyces sp. NPDC003635]